MHNWKHTKLQIHKYLLTIKLFLKYVINVIHPIVRGQQLLKLVTIKILSMNLHLPKQLIGESILYNLVPDVDTRDRFRHTEQITKPTILNFSYIGVICWEIPY